MSGNPYKFNWEPIYRAYLPELALGFISDYEHHRNLGGDKIRKRYPNAVHVEYVVDRNRYDLGFWEDLVMRFFNHGHTFTDKLFDHTGGMWNTMPWPGALENWIFTNPNRTVGSGIPYLDVLVKMADDDERRKWISQRINASGNSAGIPPSEQFAHLIMFREHDRIMEDPMFVAAVLDELMDYPKRHSLEITLEDCLVDFFSVHFPECLPSSP